MRRHQKENETSSQYSKTFFKIELEFRHRGLPSPRTLTMFPQDFQTSKHLRDDSCTNVQGNRGDGEHLFAPTTINGDCRISEDEKHFRVV